MKFKFESSPKKNPEKKSPIGRKLKDALVIGSAIMATAPGLAQQKEDTKQKELSPIYVTDKNDPRLRVYNDSLAIHNTSVEDMKVAGKDNLGEWLTYLADKKRLGYEITTDPYARLKKTLGKSPEPIAKHKFTEDDRYAANLYKKPVQPVIYKEKKKQTIEKELPPIYVSDKNDPRLKAYQDSMKLYSASQKGLEILRKAADLLTENKYKEAEDLIENSGYGEGVSDNVKNILFNNPKIKPIRIEKLKNAPVNAGRLFETWIYKKPVQPVIYQKPEVKKDTLNIRQKPPEQRALENKNKSSLPTQETKKFSPDGVSVYGPNGHIIGFYTSETNTFKPLPKEFAKDYGMHPEDLDFLDSKGLRAYLESTLKMNNIKIEKPE